MQRYIYSFIIGILFFLVSYFLVEISLFWSILIALVSFFASRLIFQDKDIKVVLGKLNEKNTLEESEKQIKEIKKMLPFIDEPEIVTSGKQIILLSKTIVESLEKYPNEVQPSYTFLNYYLPVTVSLLKRYEEIENQKLTSKESKNITKRIISLTKDIEASFKNHLNRMYNHELEDMDAEIDVFEAVLKHDGLLEDRIAKGVVEDEKQ